MLEKNCAGIPDDCKAMLKHRWSWGAMTFGWLWGIGNRTFWPLLSIIPGVGLIWLIVCGACGHGWAWKSSVYDCWQDYAAVQNSWDRAGFVVFFLSVLGIVAAFSFLLMSGVFYLVVSKGNCAV